MRDRARDANAQNMSPVDPHVVVLIGATGDLSRRKLLPGLLHMQQAGLLPQCRILGTSLDDFTAEDFRQFARKACNEFSHRPLSDEQWGEFEALLDYVPQGAGPEALAAAVARHEEALGEGVRRLHYLSVPPKVALPVVHTLEEAGLVERSRIVMEKPFGTDLESAVDLNAQLHEVFDESQIFRIDHFLGKEAAQNTLAFRFANGLFEPIWNRQFIDHVQIDVPEMLGLEGRGQFYESTGAYKDMVVTHLMQVLAFMAMEPPTALAPDAISEEKNKVFRSMKPIDPAQVVRGQYTGYRDEPDVHPESDTETFVALRCEIDNWRWAGVPFFLRTGKKLAEGARIISIAFREPPKSHVPAGVGRGLDGTRPPDLRPRGGGQAVAVVLRQATRHGHEAGQAQPAVRDGGDRAGGRRARGVRAADPRRHARRPHPVHHRRGHRAAVGAVPAAARRAVAGALLRTRLVGPQRDPPAGSAARVAVAVRAHLAQPQQHLRLGAITR